MCTPLLTATFLTAATVGRYSSAHEQVSGERGCGARAHAHTDAHRQVHTRTNMYAHAGAHVCTFVCMHTQADAHM